MIGRTAVIRKALQADGLLILLACVCFLAAGAFLVQFSSGLIRDLNGGLDPEYNYLSQWKFVAPVVAAGNVLLLVAIPLMGLWVVGRRALWGRFFFVALLVLAL